MSVAIPLLPFQVSFPDPLLMLTCNDSESESEDWVTLLKFRSHKNLCFGGKLMPVVFRNWHLLFLRCHAYQPHLHHVRDCSAHPFIIIIIIMGKLLAFLTPDGVKKLVCLKDWSKSMNELVNGTITVILVFLGLIKKEFINR